MSKGKNNWRSLTGKGYYIALILCVAAIGLTGFLYYRNSGADAQPVVNAGMQGETGGNTQGGSNPTAMSKATPLKTALPLSGNTVMSYAMDCLSYNATTRDWRVHDGIDIAAAAGTPVCATAAGEVYTVYQDDAMGTTVVLRHGDDYVTTYSSLDQKVEVSVGQEVTLGQTIGYVGVSAMLETALGEHVHFSVACNGISVDPETFFALN